MKTSFISLSKPVHAMPGCTNSITHAFSHTFPPPRLHPHPTLLTDGAVFSVPSRAAFTLPVLAGPVFAAARVTSPLFAPGAHPALVAATASRHTDAMSTTVRCAQLCGTGGGRGVSQEEVKRKQIQELLSVMGRPRSTTLSDG